VENIRFWVRSQKPLWLQRSRQCWHSSLHESLSLEEELLFGQIGHFRSRSDTLLNAGREDPLGVQKLKRVAGKDQRGAGCAEPHQTLQN
jgi:hypothetical protein